MNKVSIKLQLKPNRITLKNKDGQVINRGKNKEKGERKGKKL